MTYSMYNLHLKIMVINVIICILIYMVPIKLNTLEDIIYGLFREFKPSIALHRDVRYDCPCSRESYVDYIKRLPKAELEDMRTNGPNPLEVVCRNCGSVYKIPLSDIL